MSAPRCRQCKQRSVWRYKNNDISACKRCYHQVWNTTDRIMPTWGSTVKSLLWLGLVCWMIGAGLVRLDRSVREIRAGQPWFRHE